MRNGPVLAEATGAAGFIPALDVRQAQWAHEVARSIAAEKPEWRCTVTSVRGDSAGWYLGRALAFRPPVATRPAAGAAAGDLFRVLRLHDGTIDEIERATGLAGEFSGHGTLSTDCAGVSITCDDLPIGEIVPLAPPRYIPPTIPWVPAAFECSAARLSIYEAEAISPGDLILLSAAPWPMAPVPGHLWRESHVFDPNSGVLCASSFSTGPQGGRGDQESTFMTDMDNSTGQLMVPVTVRLNDLLLTQDLLARMAEVGTVELGPVTDGLTVTLGVGGRQIAQGELVRIGDRFAVLIDDPAPSAFDGAEPEPVAPPPPHDGDFGMESD